MALRRRRPVISAQHDTDPARAALSEEFVRITDEVSRTPGRAVGTA